MTSGRVVQWLATFPEQLWRVTKVGAASSGSSDLQDALTDHFAAVGGDGRGWDVRLSVTTNDDPDAAARAVKRGHRSRPERTPRRLGCPSGPSFGARQSRKTPSTPSSRCPTSPRFLGPPQVTEALGVSRQRLHELRGSGRFPAPAYELAATPLWIRSTVDSFLAGWDRKPGRPANTLKWANELAADYRVMATI